MNITSVGRSGSRFNWAPAGQSATTFEVRAGVNSKANMAPIPSAAKTTQATTAIAKLRRDMEGLLGKAFVLRTQTVVHRAGLDTSTNLLPTATSMTGIASPDTEICRWSVGISGLLSDWSIRPLQSDSRHQAISAFCGVHRPAF
jgi:hypothetical protein